MNEVQKKRNNIVKILIVILILLVGFSVGYIVLNNINDNDNKTSERTNGNNEKTSNKFKVEYENLNGQKLENSDQKYLSIQIDEDNPMIYTSIDKIIDTIENGTGIIYLGYPTCPWCRNAVPVLIDAAKDAEIDEILYLNMHDVRDQYEVVDGELVQTKTGDKRYADLLASLDEVLDPYIVTDIDGKEYDTGEKRIYVPMVIFVKDGVVVGTHVATVDLKENQSKYDRLDDEQYEELKNIYIDYIEAIYQEYCDEAC